MDIIITDHAVDMMAERGIDENQIKRVLQRGSKIKQTGGFKSVYTYIGVCYKIVGDKYIIKTVTIERWFEWNAISAIREN